MKFFKLAVLLAGLLSVSSAASAETGSLAYLRMDTVRGQVVATVIDRDTGKGPQLQISCEGKCELEPYVEEIWQSPLGLFRLSDVTDNLITTWASGVGYVVRIYSLASTKVRKVLDENSREQPSFFTDNQGREHIRTFVRASERTTKTIQHDWVWTGSDYVRTTPK